VNEAVLGEIAAFFGFYHSEVFTELVRAEKGLEGLI
jgi:hypothetical protein